MRQRDATRFVSQVWGQIPAFRQRREQGSRYRNQHDHLHPHTALRCVSGHHPVVLYDARWRAAGRGRHPTAATQVERRREDVPTSVSQIFGGFLRAQLVVGLIYTALTWLALVLVGQANSLPVALICGVLMLLPFIGTFLAIVPPVALVLLQVAPRPDSPQTDRAADCADHRAADHAANHRAARLRVYDGRASTAALRGVADRREVRRGVGRVVRWPCRRHRLRDVRGLLRPLSALIAALPRHAPACRR